MNLMDRVKKMSKTSVKTTVKPTATKSSASGNDLLERAKHIGTAQVGKSSGGSSSNAALIAKFRAEYQEFLGNLKKIAAEEEAKFKAEQEAAEAKKELVEAEAEAVAAAAVEDTIAADAAMVSAVVVSDDSDEAKIANGICVDEKEQILVKPATKRSRKAKPVLE